MEKIWIKIMERGDVMVINILCFAAIIAEIINIKMISKRKKSCNKNINLILAIIATIGLFIQLILRIFL